MSSFLKLSIILAFAVYFSACLYSSSGPVVLLNQNNFKKEVLDSKDIWLIEFFAPWCGHCKAFAPEYEKAARALKGIFKIGAVDADSEKGLASQFGISGFPTVKFFGENKNSPIDYPGQRKAEDVVSFMINKAREISNSRLKGGNSKKSSSNQSNNQKSKDVITDKMLLF